MRTTIVTEPDQEPINEREAKEQMRVEVGETVEDEFIKSLITTARRYIEQITGRALLDQTWNMYLDEWPDGDEIKIPYPPLIWTAADSSIVYTDSGETEATFAAANYDVDRDSEPGRIVLKYGKSWPVVTLRPMNPIKVCFDCGWAEPENVPAPLKHAIKLMVADMYEVREPTIIGVGVATLKTVDRLLWPYINWTFKI